ncbi:uncharacterized protein YcgI (DUF1989 family) [Nocardioides luteus]|uniref:DUF1989 domain-containing protein n=1 Tax=Nocardioides luteus TaxID=1844 RepID=A0ABQ5SYY3_9ACTN|nr:urea carboxylase-associated family protein [Nocardioides luteus]MDR7310823.1 uncharacterized protein YcgI (DUF1989 family) [Nocardioides luteus]GGR40416.1 hypothetical protein GCM10010197_01730 [Nocardioides luteus]GLJ69397.1 hypothetical protein GCM10017579_34330 [Nocardioides luteus]
MDAITLVARTGRAIRLGAGDSIAIVNLFGQQVVDTWAVSAIDPTTVLSMAHSRMANGRLAVEAGDTLVGSDREPMLTLESDTSGGRHDTLIPACDPARYRQLGVVGHHASCATNFRDALQALAVPVPSQVPQPLNLFMNVPVAGDGSLGIEPPTSRPGDRVTLRAVQPVVVVLSACPQDLAPTNGAHHEPRDVELWLRPCPDHTGGRPSS